MAEELGRIEKPDAAAYQGERKLFFVPLVGVWLEADEGFNQIYRRYWDQVEAHLQGLEQKLGGVKRIYHEFMLAAGDDGLRIVKELHSQSATCIESRLKRGASIEQAEEADILTEFLDWSRCLSLGLQSRAVWERVQADYEAANRRRNEHVVKRIGETLKSGESGLLFMREDHQLQFPADIQVFYVAPPALDELKRWLREQDEQARRAGGAPAAGKEKEPAGDAAKAAKKKKSGGKEKTAPEAEKKNKADA